MPGADIFYICNICKFVVDGDEALDHLTGHLDGEHCSLCSCIVDDLGGHIPVHLSKFLRCPTCGAVYSSSKDYRTHRDSHRSICFHCGESFDGDKILALHIQADHLEVEGNGLSNADGTDTDIVSDARDDCATFRDESDSGWDDMVRDNDGNHQNMNSENGENVLLAKAQSDDDYVPGNDTESIPSPVPEKTVVRKRGRPRGSKSKGRPKRSKRSTIRSSRSRKKTETLKSSGVTSKLSKIKVEKHEPDAAEETSAMGAIEKHLPKPKGKASPKRRGRKPKEPKPEPVIHHCETCGESFPNWKRLRSHMNNVGCHKCLVCGARYKQKTNLMFHMRVHTGEKPNLCSLCGKRFRTTGGLDDHVRRHNNVKPFQCRHCAKKFVQVGHRNRHERLVHTRQKLYECTICGKTFTLPFHARRHALIHSGEKQFECATCGKQVLDLSNFKKHLEVHKKRGELVLPVDQQTLRRITPTDIIISRKDPSSTSESKVTPAPLIQNPEVNLASNEMIQNSDIVQNVQVIVSQQETDVVCHPANVTIASVTEQKTIESAIEHNLLFTNENQQPREIIGTPIDQLNGDPHPIILAPAENLLKFDSYTVDGAQVVSDFAINQLPFQENVTVITLS